MYRNSIILGETADYPIAFRNNENYSICICINSNLRQVKDKIQFPYIKVYFNENGENARSIFSGMCRISLLEPKYIGDIFEDFIFSEEEKEEFIKFLSDNNYEVWNNILFRLYYDFNYNTIYDICPSIPDYSKLQEFTLNSPINHYHRYRMLRLKSFYDSLSYDSYYSNGIIYKGKFIYTLDDERNNRFRVYNSNNLIDITTPYRLYEIKDKQISFIPNIFYTENNDEEISIQLQYTSEPCKINPVYQPEFIFSIYEVIVLVISARLNLPIKNLICDI